MLPVENQVGRRNKLLYNHGHVRTSSTFKAVIPRSIAFKSSSSSPRETGEVSPKISASKLGVENFGRLWEIEVVTYDLRPQFANLGEELEYYIRRPRPVAESSRSNP
jgi:hypothetical protein